MSPKHTLLNNPVHIPILDPWDIDLYVPLRGSHFIIFYAYGLIKLMIIVYINKRLYFIFTVISFIFT